MKFWIGIYWAVRITLLPILGALGFKWLNESNWSGVIVCIFWIVWVLCSMYEDYYESIEIYPYDGVEGDSNRPKEEKLTTQDWDRIIQNFREVDRG